MPADDEAFLVNKSYTQHMLLTIGLVLTYLCLTGLMIYAYFIKMKEVEGSLKGLATMGGITIASLIFGPTILWFLLNLRNTPTHIDITKERVRLRYQWGEASFGLEEVVCFIGSEKGHLFSSKVHGALLKDGGQVKMFILDDEFVDDLFALSRKKKVPMEKDWNTAQQRL